MYWGRTFGLFRKKRKKEKKKCIVSYYMMYIITLQWQTGFEWQTGPGISSAPSPPNAPCRLGVFTQFFSVRPSTQGSRLGGPRRSFPEAFNSQRKLLNCQVSSSIFFLPRQSVCSLRLAYDGRRCVRSLFRGWRLRLPELFEASSDHFAPPELGESHGSVSIQN